MKTLHTLIGAAFIAGASTVAVAEPVEPVTLSSAELDGVTAGLSFVFLNAYGQAHAEGEGVFVLNHTFSESGSEGHVIEIGPFDYGYGGTFAYSESASF